MKKFVMVGVVAFLGLGVLAHVAHSTKVGMTKTAHGIVYIVTLGHKG